MRRITFALLMLVMGVGTGCSISSVASDPRGIKGVDGDHLTHINTRNYAVHLFMTKPIWGELITECEADENRMSLPL